MFIFFTERKLLQHGYSLEQVTNKKFSGKIIRNNTTYVNYMFYLFAIKIGMGLMITNSRNVNFLISLHSKNWLLIMVITNSYIIYMYPIVL